MTGDTSTGRVGFIKVKVKGLHCDPWVSSWWDTRCPGSHDPVSMGRSYHVGSVFWRDRSGGLLLEVDEEEEAVETLDWEQADLGGR
jgi:hypothetical protein